MDFEQLSRSVYRDVEEVIGSGRVANYIPALAKIDPEKFGMAIIGCDGETAVIGDADEPFSIQSVSKVFTLSLALELAGADLWQHVGREPSGSSFNSIVQLEREKGIPRNPFINAGALVVTDALVQAFGRKDAQKRIVAALQYLTADDTVSMDEEVAASEAETGHRNTSLAHFMRGFGNIRSDVGDVLDTYFHQCALRMSCRQLATAGLYLANGGINPADGVTFVRPERARRINAIMLTCGHYDASGDFAFRVGLPGKSGVGGGILAIAPGRASIAVWSPGLNDVGNSLVGSLAMESLAAHSGWSVFDPRLTQGGPLFEN